MPNRLRFLILTVTVTALIAAGSAAYVVKPGDSLSAIAIRFDTTVAALAAANGIANPDRIYVGQELVLPGEVVAPAGTHVVAPGDTLGAIARRYGTTVAAVAAANGISNPDRIVVGAALRIGAEVAAPEPVPFAPAVPPEATHVVAWGDTLGAIATRHGTTVAALMELNGIRDPDRIRAGAVLAIPTARWVCPVPGSSFVNDWGFPRSGGRTHQGNDLFAPRGTQVLAPVGGTVEQVDGELGGLQFWLHGDDGHLYIGSHLDELGARGRVQAGAVLGTVGDSGNARGAKPHLHFEILPNGQEAVNPYPTLTEYCG